MGVSWGIRDLMSPVISEQHYKNGMKKDENGFMDIDWCCSKVLNNWDELRSVFMQANAKKAIAPTQVGSPSLTSCCWLLLATQYTFQLTTHDFIHAIALATMLLSTRRTS